MDEARRMRIQGHAVVQVQEQDSRVADPSKPKWKKFRGIASIVVAVIMAIFGAVLALLSYQEYKLRPQYKIIRADPEGNLSEELPEEDVEDGHGYVINEESSSTRGCQLFEHVERAHSLTGTLDSYYLYCFGIWLTIRLVLIAALIKLKVGELKGKEYMSEFNGIKVSSLLTFFRAFFEVTTISQTYPVLIYEWGQDCFSAPETLTDQGTRTALFVSFYFTWTYPFIGECYPVILKGIVNCFRAMGEAINRESLCGFLGTCYAGILAFAFVLLVIIGLFITVILYINLTLPTYTMLAGEVILFLLNFSAFQEVFTVMRKRANRVRSIRG